MLHGLFVGVLVKIMLVFIAFLFESCFLLSIVTNGQKKACAVGV